LSFAANFETIQLLPEKIKHKISSIGVQLLTIDEISLMIMKDTNLRLNMLETYEKLIDQLIENDFSENEQNTLYTVLYEFKYMARTNSLKYTIDHTTFIEGLLE
jgi:hypothetical protein